MYCVVGLGNPGEEYIGTRHNVGFRVADRVAADSGNNIRRPLYRALTATARICRTEVLIMKPQTYMNRSGASVLEACRALAIAAQDCVVVHDDVDLPLGRLRIRVGGGSGGHRGMDSIIEVTGQSDFVRLRVGVGRPTEAVDTSAHVLADFEPQEQALVQSVVENAASAVHAIVCDGVKPAMDKYNGPVVTT